MVERAPERRTTPSSMDELETRFEQWGHAHPDVRALVVVGSRARRDHPADEWADLDLGVFTREPKRYASDAGWLREIGDVWTVHHDHTGVTWHVLFAGGLDAGVAPIPASTLRAASVLLPAFARAPWLRRALPALLRRRVDSALRELTAYAGRGARVLLDKDGLATRLLSAVPEEPPARPPTAAQFAAAVDEFWFLAVWNAKHLRRGELWYAKTFAGDGQMKGLLLTMLEWHARAMRGADTWDSGRFLEQWVDPSAASELPATFGHYDERDLLRSATATMNLFRRIARETARELGYPYPEAADACVTAWVDECRAAAEPR